MSLRRAVSMVLLLAVLSACGFQLRGSASLPSEMAETYLRVADDSTLFVRELRLLLEANGVRLVERAGDETAVLNISRQSLSRRSLTISGEARVREFELIFVIDFDLKDARGQVLVEPTSLRLTRDFQFDEREILAASREEELLRADLRRAMAVQVIRRLEASGP